jgi:hypothetical protein
VFLRLCPNESPVVNWIARSSWAMTVMMLG